MNIDDAADVLTKDLEPSRRFSLRPRNFSLLIPGLPQTSSYSASLKRKFSDIESENVNATKKLAVRTKSEGSSKTGVSRRKTKRKINEDRENVAPQKASQNVKVVFKIILFL